MDYDIIVIGGGPSGYTGAIRAAKLGQRVALVEERHLGGTCLNRGCIPTKALLHSGEAFHLIKHSALELGISIENPSIDESAVYARKDRLVASLRGGIESLIKANKITLYSARATLLDKHTVMAGEERLTARFILIASGSRPAGFDSARPINGIDSALNSDDVLASPLPCERIAIIGAGVIGVELASYYSMIGRSVTLIAPSDRIVKMMSRDVSVQLAASLKKNGVKIITDASIINVTSKTVELESKGKAELIEADAVISCLGRRANIEGLGLDNAGVEADRFIKVDENMRTSADNIYASGDVTGGIQLAHYAASCAITAIESMLNLEHSISLSVVPSCIYTQPEIAAVGRKEEQVENAKVGKFLMGANGKSLIEGVNRGFIRVIADANDVVVGAEIFSVRASDIIGELALAVANKLTLHDITKTIHAHPTVYESIAEATEDIFGLATHKI